MHLGMVLGCLRVMRPSHTSRAALFPCALAARHLAHTLGCPAVCLHACLPFAACRASAPPLLPRLVLHAARCIDTYVEQRVAEAEGRREAGAAIDPRLVAVVERLFDRCFADRQYEQAVGIALESRRLDQLERAIAGSPGEHRC